MVVVSPQQFDTWLAQASTGNGLGDVEAMYWVGYCCWWGKGTKKNYVAAAAWFRRASDIGSGKAMCRLGNCYCYGCGVPDDEERALQLFQSAIPILKQEAQEQDDSESMFLLGIAFECTQQMIDPPDSYYGDDSDEEEDSWERHPYHWYKMAADREHAAAQYWLGHAHEHGRWDLELDPATTIAFYQRSAENGDEKSQLRLARCYRGGLLGVEKDFVLALKWFRLAVQSYAILGGSANADQEEDKEEDNSAAREQKALLKEISLKRDHMLQCVAGSLAVNSDHSNSAGASSSLALWGNALAVLLQYDKRPAGYSPAFVVLKELSPQLSILQKEEEPRERDDNNNKRDRRQAKKRSKTGETTKSSTSSTIARLVCCFGKLW